MCSGPPWNVSNHNMLFIKSSGDTLTIYPYDSKLASVATLDTVAHHLIRHGIPPQWINHAYMFGLHHLNHQSHLRVGLFQDLYCKTDHERLQ